ENFVEYLKQNLLTPREQTAIRVDEWVYGPGVPSNAPVVQSERIARARAQAEQFVWGRPPSELETEEWGTQEWLLFFRALPKLTASQMADLDREFDLTQSGNSEILFAWLMKALESGYTPADEALETFLTSMGRRKFLEPLYKELAKTPAGLERAREIYSRARPTYHPVSQQTIDEVLGWKEEKAAA
ncbi:MAG TPA: leukotriene A4 hydrolase C-terminal domain-containing protein, partial [Thermoanaerobaculia bacterium]|nr:leukotriene A4 hydrolase C-terminal domain-containing protein [Thermoanaerobaculia bacterium]